MTISNRWIVVLLILMISIAIVASFKLSSRPSSSIAEKELEAFEPGNFNDSTNIENVWFPLKPGTRFVYEGKTTEGGDEIPRRIEFTVTDLTKEITGVRTIVAWIVDYRNAEVTEKEIAFYGQDNDGNVWYLGEYPEEYEKGKFVAAPTWIAGQKDARAGIMMKAEPKPGTPRYFEGWGPEVDWSDWGKVDEVGQATCVPIGCYEDVLVIAESSLGETNAYQLKYYARGVGNIRVGWRGSDAIQEELELVEFSQLESDALAQIREQALELEKSAYERSKDVYGQTQPAH